jgi:hypothetical protein
MRMFCDRHENTELMRRAGGIEEREGKLYAVTILYCPHCKRDYARLLKREGEEIQVKL